MLRAALPKKHYIAPQLLSLEQPDYPWDNAENLILRYTYEFMPKGILTRCIVALHQYIATDSQERQIVWRTGVLLTREATRAEVVEFYEKRLITIRLQGSNKRGLLEVIAHEFNKIHDSFPRLKYKQLIPCNCNMCRDTQKPHMYDLERLRRRLRKGKITVECDESFEDVDVRGLIDDVGYAQTSQTVPYQGETTGNTVKIVMGDQVDQSHSGDSDNVGRNKPMS